MKTDLERNGSTEKTDLNQKNRHRQTNTERQREIQTHRDRQKKRERGGGGEGEREGGIKTDPDRNGSREKQTSTKRADTDRQTDRH